MILGYPCKAEQSFSRETVILFIINNKLCHAKLCLCSAGPSRMKLLIKTCQLNKLYGTLYPVLNDLYCIESVLVSS